jgi:hypothetical protein
MEKTRQYSAVTHDPDLLVFRTDLSSRLVLGIISGFFVAMGALATLDGAIIIGPVVAAVGMGFWLHYVTLNLCITKNEVFVRRYGRNVFSANISEVHAEIGKGGELRTHTVLILEAAGQKRIELLRTLFGRKALGEIAKSLGLKDQIPGGIF